MCGTIQQVSTAHKSIREAEFLLGLMQVNGVPGAVTGVLSSFRLCDQLTD
jgi:hypothetical protein